MTIPEKAAEIAVEIAQDETHGAQDAYQQGDKVWYPDRGDDVWISQVNNNVWEPGTPGLWEKEETP